MTTLEDDTSETDQPKVVWDSFRVKPKPDTDLCADMCDDIFTSLKKVAKIVIQGVCFLIIIVAGKAALGSSKRNPYTCEKE